MPQPTLSIYTQTPYVRFLRDDIEPGTRLSALREGTDHLPSPGGVTRMMRTLLAHVERSRRMAGATWVSLSSSAPTRVRLSDRVVLDTVRLEPHEQAEYARAKGALWDAVHGLSPAPIAAGELDALEHLSVAMAQRATATTPDLHYVHDFQLLPLARHLPDRSPRVFHWHIPVANLAGEARRYVAEHLNDYDAVIVSTRGYAKALRAAGVRVPAHARYPYIDETRHVVTRDELAAFEARWRLDPQDVVFAVVARLDPMKSHDVAIRALARLPATAKL
ncbi:MAG TPA: hypothetical protein VM582_01250, partial [Candidatus Thermoplasmatota archaeon]|nr:hypothetical protein [Candidatus Thermoplasmatota archaeon]